MIDLLKHVWHILGWCISHTVAGVRKLIDYHVLLIIVLIAMTACLFSVMFDINNAVMAFKTILGTHDKKETIEFIAFGMGGIIAAIVAVAVSRRAEAQEQNNMLIEKGHVDERFKSAIQNLGHNKASVRIASFYQFYYLAKDQPDNLRKSVFDILCSYLRAMPHGQSHLKDKKYPTEEYQTLLNILFKPDDKYVFAKFEADLRNSYLVRTDLSDANLSNAKLYQANLFRANLSKADLSNANLVHANLSNADFTSTNISGAHLSHANLSGANLLGANLSRASLSYANCSNADFPIANLSNTRLMQTDFSEANLSGTNLSNANFWGANLSYADLMNANLSNTKLLDTKLKDVCNIDGADFRGAKIGDKPITKDDIPSDIGKYYADWNPPPKKEEN